MKMKRLTVWLPALLIFASAGAQELPQKETKPAQCAENIGQEPSRETPGARLRMDVPTHDFGDVPRRGGDLIWDFDFVNDGSAPLVITRVITSCSCLKASFPKRPVPPGGEAAIRITYEPHKSEPGAFHKVIQIYSNAVDGRHVITVQGCSMNKKEK